MLIHQDKNSKVHLELETIPAVMYFTINGQTFRYGLDRQCMDNECQYNQNIVSWMENHREEIKDILYNWSLDREINEIIDEII